MQELQSDDFFIPAFLVKLMPQAEPDRRDAQTEDFLKGIEAWAESYPVDECVE